MKTYVLGISGGQDSTLAGRLAQLTMEEMRAETGDDSYQFIAIRLPYGVQADESDAQAALAFIQPDVSLTINIKESTDAMVAAVNANGLAMSDFNKGNAKARMRMIAQYAIAGERKGLLLEPIMPLKISLVSLPSTVMEVQISCPSSALTSVKVSNF